MVSDELPEMYTDMVWVLLRDVHIMIDSCVGCQGCVPAKL